MTGRPHLARTTLIRGGAADVAPIDTEPSVASDVVEAVDGDSSECDETEREPTDSLRLRAKADHRQLWDNGAPFPLGLGLDALPGNHAFGELQRR